MKTRIFSVILSYALALYPLMASAVTKTASKTQGLTTFVVAGQTVSSKKNHEKKVRDCFEAARRNGAIPETADRTERIELKAAKCRDDSVLIVAVVPVTDLDDARVRGELERQLDRLTHFSMEDLTALAAEVGVDISGIGGLEKLTGFLVEFVGENFFAAYDMSGFLTGQLSAMGVSGLERPWDDLAGLVAAGGDLTDFEAMFGMQPEDLDMINPQSFYMDGHCPPSMCGSPGNSRGSQGGGGIDPVQIAVATAAGAAAVAIAAWIFWPSDPSTPPTQPGTPPTGGNGQQPTCQITSCASGSQLNTATCSCQAASSGGLQNPAPGTSGSSCSPACASGQTCQNGSCVGSSTSGTGGTCSPACASGQTCQNGSCVASSGSGGGSSYCPADWESGGDGGEGCGGSEPTEAEKEAVKKEFMQMWGSVYGNLKPRYFVHPIRFIQTSQPGPDGNDSAPEPKEKPEGNFVGGKNINHFIYCPEDDPDCGNLDKTRGEGEGVSRKDRRCWYVHGVEECDDDRAPDTGGPGEGGPGPNPTSSAN